MGEKGNVEYLEGQYENAIENAFPFECFDVFSLAGYYLKNYPGRELEQLGIDLFEERVSLLRGMAAKTILELAFD